MKTWLKFTSAAIIGFAAGFAGIYLTNSRSANSEATASNKSEKPSEVDWATLRELDATSFNMTEKIKNLNGTNVRVPGFMIPLEDNQSIINEFLLVPSPMACVHVPPPPPNQIILVRMAPGREARMSFGPIWVQGKLQVGESNGPYGKSAYEIAGELTEPYQ